jgi:SAM-dependent methyltransferase
LGYGSGCHRLIPSMTYQWDPQVARVVREAGSGALVVDLGAGGRRIAPHVKTVDFAQCPGTDHVVDLTSEQTPFAAGSVDLVICTGVFEHITDPDALTREAHRMLRAGGTFHVEMPFMQVYHEDPIDERRLTVPGLRRYLNARGFVVEREGTHIGPTVALLGMIVAYVNLLLYAPNLPAKILCNAVLAVLSWVLVPLKYLDRFVGKRVRAHELAFGIYATARKR